MRICLPVLIVSTAANLYIVESAKANPSSTAQLFDNVIITIQSPENKSYNSNTLSLNFTVETNNEYQPLANYSLNGQNPTSVSTTVVSSTLETSWYYTYSGGSGSNHTYRYMRYKAQGNATLSDLPDGTCNITIQRYGNPSKPIVSSNITFTIDTKAPLITIISPQTTTYPPAPVPLKFTVNEQTSWTGYSLNDQANITLTTNTTLTLQGTDSIVIFANDTAGNMGKSQTTYFEVDPTPYYPTTSPSTQQPTPKSSTSSPDYNRAQTPAYPLIIATVAAAFAATAGILSYLIKRRTQR